MTISTLAKTRSSDRRPDVWRGLVPRRVRAHRFSSLLLMLRKLEDREEHGMLCCKLTIVAKGRRLEGSGGTHENISDE